MNKSLTKKIITRAVITLAAILLMQLIYHIHAYLEKKSNHEKVVRLVDQDLMFRWDTMDSDLEHINNWITTDYFDKKLVITVSGGIASGSGETDVLKQADENLYRSKEGGRNRITVTE